ncbi:phage tail protein [Xanthobacter autotrophicus]|uniref:phage tail protein n=1 Tax=Xanthobacter autotrophicus TaxID=280 RepID=UPI00372C16ED
MALETFVPPIPPSPSTGNKPELKLLEAQFGDGYTQTTRDGMNHIRDNVSLTWDLLLPAQADAIDAFFRTKGGDTPFLYKPVMFAAPVRWTCKEWSHDVIENGFRTITATLKRDFNVAI